MGSVPPASSLAFHVNGRPLTADRPAPQTTLLEFLRARGLTGAKEGCAEGECGSCSVLMVVNHGDGAEYRVVNSCLMFLPAAANREFYTVEGLAEPGTLCDAQRAMAEAGGSQCGYCTPGFVVSLFAEQYRRDRRGPCDPLAMAGNLCRCTGYRPIRDAALSLGPPPAGLMRDRLERPARPLGAVEDEHFSRPETLAGCVEALSGHPGAVVVAGMTDLGVESNLKHRRFPHLVSVEAVPELHAFDDGDDTVRIGAAVPLADIGGRWAGAPAAIQEWLTLFASPPIRNRATLGGNLATASPIGDAAPLLLALDARLHLSGPSGARRVPLREFFVAYRQTALRAGELIVTVEIPKPWPDAIRFYKVAKRRLDDISTVAAAMAVSRDPRGRVVRARFAFGGVGPTPRLCDEAESAVIGQPWTMSAVERVQSVLGRELTPMSDHRGSRAYRLDVSMSLVEKFWAESRA
jgi:xanthine dehydrogenase small subunit